MTNAKIFDAVKNDIILLKNRGENSDEVLQLICLAESILDSAQKQAEGLKESPVSKLDDSADRRETSDQKSPGFFNSIKRFFSR
jgi:ADP-ribosylglycohydrolase